MNVKKEWLSNFKKITGRTSPQSYSKWKSDVLSDLYNCNLEQLYDLQKKTELSSKLLDAQLPSNVSSITMQCLSLVTVIIPIIFSTLLSIISIIINLYDFEMTSEQAISFSHNAEKLLTSFGIDSIEIAFTIIIVYLILWVASLGLERLIHKNKSIKQLYLKELSEIIDSAITHNKKIITKKSADVLS